MAVINRRSRLVNFRLSESELEALKNACYAHGARSISDFARGAVLAIMQAKNAPDQTDPHITQIDQRMSDLEMRISLMYRLMENQYRNGTEATSGRLVQAAESRC